MKKLIIIGIVSIFSFCYSQNYEIISEDNWIKIGYNAHFPEGPAYDGEGSVFTSNCYGRWINKFSKSIFESIDTISLSNEGYIFSDFRKDTSVVNRTNGLKFFNGELHACEYGNGTIIKYNKNGEPVVLSSGFEGKRFNRPNDICFDGKSYFYFTDPKSYNKEVLDGRIFRYNIENNQNELVYKDLAFPNGIAVSNDGKYLYVCESAKQIITKLRIGNEGELYQPETFAELPGGDPDGIEFDQHNNLLVAHYGGKAIYKISPDGNIIAKIITPGKKPSNVEIIDSFLMITECETNSLYILKLE